MKYPQLASMPAALQDWLDAELESRGIDAIAYTRYILSLLQTDYLEPQEDLFSLGGGKRSLTQCKERIQEQFQEGSVSGRKARRRHKREESRRSWDGEQLKRSAAVECLMSASEEKCGIEKLVDELCVKLKSIQSEGVGEPDPCGARTPAIAMTSDESGAETDGYGSSTPEEQAEKYYAAFPPLSDHSDSTASSMAVLVSSNSVWHGQKILTDSFGKNQESGNEGNEDKGDSQENEKDDKNEDQKEWTENKENLEEQEESEEEEDGNQETSKVSFIVPKVCSDGRQRVPFLRAKPVDTSPFMVQRHVDPLGHGNTRTHFESDCSNDDSAVEDGDSDSSPYTRQQECASERGFDTPEGYIGDASSRESSEDRDRCIVQKEKEMKRESMKEKLEMKDKRSKGEGGDKILPLRPKLRLYQRQGTSSSSLENSDHGSDQEFDCNIEKRNSKIRNGKGAESDESVLAQLVAKFNSEVAAIWDQVISAREPAKSAEDAFSVQQNDGHGINVVEFPSLEPVNPLTPNIGLLSTFLSPAEDNDCSAAVEGFNIGRQKLQDLSAYIQAGTNICSSIWSEGQEGTEARAYQCSEAGSLNQSFEFEAPGCGLSPDTGGLHNSVEILDCLSDGTDPVDSSAMSDLHLFFEHPSKSDENTENETPSENCSKFQNDFMERGKVGVTVDEVGNELSVEVMKSRDESSATYDLEEADGGVVDADGNNISFFKVVPDDETLHVKLKAIWDKFDALDTPVGTGNFSLPLKPHELYWEINMLNLVGSSRIDTLPKEIHPDTDENAYSMEQLLGSVVKDSPVSASEDLEGLDSLFPTSNSPDNFLFTSKREADSFGALNHQEDVSSFTQVVPRTKGSQPEVVSAISNKSNNEDVNQNLTCTFETLKICEGETGSQETKKSEEEENLLISPRTHFRPIRQESQETSNSSDQYEDGTVFNIEHDDEKPVFTRSESGTLYLHNENDPEDSPKKYMVYKQKVCSNTGTDDSHGVVLEQDVEVSFLPKFRVKQNEKFCQTDLDSGLDEEEEESFLDDVEDMHEVEVSDEVNQETMQFFFPFDSLQLSKSYHPQETYCPEVGGPVSDTCITSCVEDVCKSAVCDEIPDLHEKYNDRLHEVKESPYKIHNSMATMFLQNYHWSVQAGDCGEVSDCQKWKQGSLHLDWANKTPLKEKSPDFQELRKHLLLRDQRENDCSVALQREILAGAWKECCTEKWMLGAKVDKWVRPPVGPTCKKQLDWEVLYGRKQKDSEITTLQEEPNTDWTEPLQVERESIIGSVGQKGSDLLEKQSALLEESCTWVDPEEWPVDLKSESPEEDNALFSEVCLGELKEHHGLERLRSCLRSVKSEEQNDLPREVEGLKLDLEKWTRDLAGLETVERSLRQWYIPWSEGSDAKQQFPPVQATQHDTSQVYMKNTLSSVEKKAYTAEEKDNSYFTQSNLNSRLRDEITAEGEQLFEDIHHLRQLDLGTNWLEDDVNEFCDWLPEDETLPVESQTLEDIVSSDMPAMPTSGKIMYSADLEEEWKQMSRPFNVQVPVKDRKSKRLPAGKRPCSFYMDGNCHRFRCKFSHDLSTITCRFWEEGSCFKGITCPFLHGYPSEFECSETSENEKGFELNSESDFPSLVLTKEVKPHSSHGVSPKAGLGTKRKKCRFPRYAGCDASQERKLYRCERRASHTSSEETSDTKEYIRAGKGGKPKRFLMARRVGELRKSFENKTLCRKLNCRSLQKKHMEDKEKVKDT